MIKKVLKLSDLQDYGYKTLPFNPELTANAYLIPMCERYQGGCIVKIWLNNSQETVLVEVFASKSGKTSLNCFYAMDGRLCANIPFEGFTMESLDEIVNELVNSLEHLKHKITA